MTKICNSRSAGERCGVKVPFWGEAQLSRRLLLPSSSSSPRSPSPGAPRRPPARTQRLPGWGAELSQRAEKFPRRGGTRGCRGEAGLGNGAGRTPSRAPARRRPRPAGAAPARGPAPCHRPARPGPAPLRSAPGCRGAVRWDEEPPCRRLSPAFLLPCPAQPSLALPCPALP